MAYNLASLWPMTLLTCANFLVLFLMDMLQSLESFNRRVKLELMSRFLFCGAKKNPIRQGLRIFTIFSVSYHSFSGSESQLSSSRN